MRALTTLTRTALGLLVAVCATLPCAAAATGAAASAEIYAAPMATIVGQGLIRFKVTLGMLVNAKRDPVGIYRSYPSHSAVPLSEQYTLPMLATRAGAILASYHDIPLLVLHGHIAARAGDYPLTLSYLTGVARREYAHCVIHVRYAGGQWRLSNAEGRAVSQVVVVSGLSGIRSVSACAAP